MPIYNHYQKQFITLTQNFKSNNALKLFIFEMLKGILNYFTDDRKNSSGYRCA
jgi:hypothetical protein